MVWTPREQMYAENLKVNDEELSALKKLLVSELDKIMPKY